MTRYHPLEFPPDFLWGAATASHQNEGNNRNNDFWAWEHLPGKIVDGSISGLATDWWDAERGRAEADFDRAEAMGLKTMRLSVEWSRVQPAPNRRDEAAIDRYRQLLLALHQRGIRPMVTLHHFTNPLWLAEQGGWLDDDVVGKFVDYANYVVQKLGDLCDLWCTINEPMVYAYVSHLRGEWSPGAKSFGQTFRVAAAMAQAHVAAAQAIHQFQPQAGVGLVKNIPVFDPARPRHPLDRLVTGWQDRLFNQRILDAVYKGHAKFPLAAKAANPAPGHDDFIGINYYGPHSVRFDLREPFTLFGKNVAPPQAEMWDAPWADRQIDPAGLRRAIKRMAAYGKPVYITENGLADPADTRRPRFLLTHLAAVQRAIAAGADVRGYYYWTFVDNYEWVEGWTTPFGLIALNPETQARTPRKSAALYRDLIAANAITPEIVEQYAPEAIAEIFEA